MNNELNRLNGSIGSRRDENMNFKDHEWINAVDNYFWYGGGNITRNNIL